LFFKNHKIVCFPDDETLQKSVLPLLDSFDIEKNLGLKDPNNGKLFNSF
jgi:hypothetical protein